MLLTGSIKTASTVDAKENSDTMGFEVVLEVCNCFAGFVDGIIISTSVFLFVQSYLYWVGGYLPFVLKAIIENNKIDYKNNSKIIILIIKLYKAMQS